MILWIASYPKSGNTWLRSLLTAYYYSEDGMFDFNLLSKIYQFPSEVFFRSYKKNFLNISDTAKYWIDAQEKINSDNKFKIFKTHNAYLEVNKNEFTNKNNTLGCIYIVRDPRNMITSIKNHYEHSYDEALSFMTNKKGFLYKKKNNQYVDFNFLSSWQNHYISWVYQKDFPIIIIRYEDLEKNPKKTFEEAVRFINDVGKLNHKYNKKKAERCIESCDFKLLKKKEEMQGFMEKAVGQKSKKKINFFNLGKKNQWQKILPKKILEKMNELFKEDIKRFGYEQVN